MRVRDNQVSADKIIIIESRRWWARKGGNRALRSGSRYDPAKLVQKKGGERETTSYRISDGREWSVCRGRKAIAVVKGPCELQNRHSKASKWKHDPVALAILLCLDSRCLPIEFPESSTSIYQQSSAKIARIPHRLCYRTFCRQSPARVE